ncbi:uncharacterized protein CTRU02_214203 [Colletotrichum truncatum]|uniref:Uncharacterized protein n=1 Tax=Colletotrichum truncatum TaxID=5467 RepID=A0ACC3YHW9_COLTU|nr:uncharacterized protein CTRU02_11282 [Colletotrichum truncatum]KAF6786024.1 hypothetical protein CTRU02_11282 [Colletotrichum truncatum]
MAPIPPMHVDAPGTRLHRLYHRDAEQGRIAGMLVGCLLAAILALGIMYFCFNCAFSPKKQLKKTGQHEHAHKSHTHHHAHPQKSCHGVHALPAQVPHTHKWIHHHHRRSHQHHQQKHQKPRSKHPAKKKRKSTHRKTRSTKPRGTTVRFLPMPLMEVPMAPAAAAGVGMGIGMGMGIPDDDFIDYGPAPENQDLGLEMGWGVDPGFRLEQFADADDPDGEEEITCNQCCYSFWDALCGIEPASRDLRREVTNDGYPPLDDEEMAAD